MSQAALAAKIGTKQAGISRIESANYDRWSIAILRRLAEAFDLRLRVTFEEFGTLWKEVDDFSRESLLRRRFEDDPEFKEADKPKTEEIAALASLVEPPVIVTPRLSDLISAVTQANEQYKIAWNATATLAPVLAALEEHEKSWRMAISDIAESMKPAMQSLELQTQVLSEAFSALTIDPAIFASSVATTTAAHSVNSYLAGIEHTVSAITVNPEASGSSSVSGEVSTPAGNNIVYINDVRYASLRANRRRSRLDKTQKQRIA